MRRVGSLAAIPADLAARGMPAVSCEGGPRLLRELAAAGAIDELLLTLAPLLTAGDAPSILMGPALPEPARLAASLRAPRRRSPVPSLQLPGMRLRLRDTTLELEAGRPLLMGIVNANPDSFSDAVRLDTLDAQVEPRAGARRRRAPT